MTRKFILLSHERSGSHFAGEFLGSLAGFRMIDEVCNPDAVRPAKHPESFHRFRYDYTAANPDYVLESSRAGHIAFVDAFFEHLARLKAPNDIVVDIKYGHVQNFEWWWCPALERPFLLNYCQEHDIGIVHLYRENVIEAMVSTMIADRRGIWHSWQAGPDTPAQEQFELPVVQIVNRARRLQNQTRLYRDWTADNRKIEISYEEVSAGLGRDGTLDARLTEFMGAKPRKVFEPRYQKLTRPLREVVKNYAELKAACDAQNLGRFVA